jgi:hypothetical protein
MSVLETPRLIFRGNITWDPIVTNNRPQQYDEDDAQTVFGAGVDVAAFRKAAIDAVIARRAGGQEFVSNWNPHGTHRSTFYDTAIVGVDVGNGPSADDSVVNSPVTCTGMLVDLEPYGAFSSQLFFDSISFGIEGGCRIFAPRTTRMTGRYINFSRNPAGFIAGVASVVWQVSFPKANGLRLDAHDSKALGMLATSLESGDVLGLTMRWNAYRTLYFDSFDPNSDDLAIARQLRSNLAGGGFQPNPARSVLIGVLGLWRKGEPASEPGDRALLTQSDSIASAHARLSTDRLTLDLANSVPETGLDLTKRNLGDLTAVAVGADGKTVIATLGTFGYEAYRREAYEASAGIITVKVDPTAAQAVRAADIQLRQQDGTVLLAETALRAIPGAPNTYLDEGESATLDVMVLDRGKPAGAGIDVTMVNPDESAPGPVRRVTNAEGIATFSLAGKKGQIEGFVLVPGQGMPLPSQIDPQATTYAYVRTLPADTDIAALPPTWENVHGRVLRNWEAMAPCMDNWLNLRDPDQVKSFAPMLRHLTAKANFEAYRFMPVTRDMTAGERTLLHAFLEGAEMPAAVVEAAPRRSLKQLSRAMRGG